MATLPNHHSKFPPFQFLSRMDWTRGPIIGRGSSATVSVAEVNLTRQLLAVKSVDLSESELLKREQRILSQLNSGYIVKYKGWSITSENGKRLFNLVMEYAPGGSVADGAGLDEDTVQLYTRQILQGLEYLHHSGVVHCDIKGHNVLITENGAKIADFGCARLINEVSRPIAGTPLYMAPEVARGEYQGFPADVWALGCTVIQMLTGGSRWLDVSDPISLLHRVGFSNQVPEIPSFISDEAKDFLSKCLIRDFEKRWSVAQLLKHQFVQISGIRSTQKPQKKHYSLTPTSTLDGDMWESTTQIWTERRASKSASALERIGKLSEECRSGSRGGAPTAGWECDEEWMTVRSEGMQGERSLISTRAATHTPSTAARSSRGEKDGNLTTCSSRCTKNSITSSKPKPNNVFVSYASSSALCSTNPNKQTHDQKCNTSPLLPKFKQKKLQTINQT